MPGGGSGFLDVTGAPLHGGTYVSLVPPHDLSGLTVIIETSADDSCLRRNLSHFSLTFTTRGGLPGPGTTLFVWTSTQDELFVQRAPLVIAADSSFSLTVAPDSITTVSTTAGAQHGGFPDSPVPAQLPWALPYSEDFSESVYAYDAMARFFADQAGSWSVRNGSLTQVSGGQPIAWAPNGDPLTIAGSEDWVDYSVSATAVFSPKAVPATALAAPPPPPSPRRRKPHFVGGGERSNSAAVYAAACDPTDGAQLFAFNASSGWLGSGWGGNAGCVTTCGCDTTCIQMWGCGVPGCGVPYGGASYIWSLSPATKALTNFAYAGLALEANPATGTVALVPAQPAAPAQQWAIDASGLVRSAIGLCLSQVKPSLVYAQVCGRMGAYDGFNAATTPAYCTAVYASGAWALLINSRSAVGGNVTAFNSSTPHRLSVSMAGNVVESYLDGQLLASITDDTYAVGNAAVGAGWHPVTFDDFEVSAPFARTSSPVTK